MLLVFAMAAAVAIALYSELPRIAMQAQRAREQTLIMRGEQYQRAIQVYVRKFKKFPTTIDELENTNNVRFLRRKYKDPMTGKEEWRLIHVGPGGVFLDSLLHKPPAQKEQQAQNQNTFISEGPSVGGTAQAPGQPQAAALARRGSDRVTTPAPGGSVDPQTLALAQDGIGNPPPPGATTAYPGQSYTPFMPGQTPSYVGPGQDYSPGQPTVAYTAPQPYPSPQPYTPGQPFSPSGSVAAGVTTYTPGAQPYPSGVAPYAPQPFVPGAVPTSPGQTPTYMGGAAYTPGQVPSGTPSQPKVLPYLFPGQTAPSMYTPPTGTGPSPFGQQTNPFAARSGAYAGYPTTPTSSQTGGGVSSPFTPGSGTTSFGPGTAGTTGQTPGQNQALDLIRGILTSPRGSAGAAATGGQVMGGGIAGVASTLEAEGVMVYNERFKYNEWEFLYDVRKEQAKAASAMCGGMVGTGMSQPGAQGVGGLGADRGFGSTTGFGTSSGFGSQTGFGTGSPTGIGGQTVPQTSPSPFGFPQQPQSPTSVTPAYPTYPQQQPGRRP